MKSTVICFVCFTALFQSCYGLKCNTCDSETNAQCDNDFISERYLFDYSVFDYDVVCAKSVISRGTYNRTTRAGLSKQDIANSKKRIEQLKKDGFDFDFTTCSSDGCNV